VSLKHAILGFLEFGPKSGYDLKRIFDRSVSNFWPAQHSQIYGTLARLEAEGLATMNIVPQTGKPDRKVYTITDAGRRAVHDWLLQEIPSIAPRSASQIQTFFLGLLSEPEILEVLRRRAKCLEEGIEELVERVPGPDDEAAKRSGRCAELDFYTYLTLDFGIERARFVLRWVNDLIEKVERGDPKRGGLAVFESRSEETKKANAP